jgi:hypothetical protein
MSDAELPVDGRVLAAALLAGLAVKRGFDRNPVGEPVALVDPGGDTRLDEFTERPGVERDVRERPAVLAVDADERAEVGPRLRVRSQQLGRRRLHIRVHRG